MTCACTHTIAQNVEELWKQLVRKDLAALDAELTIALRDEEQAIMTSLAHAQAQKRSMLSAAARTENASREKTLVSLAWTFTATVREGAKKQLATLESTHADRLFAAVMATAVRYTDDLAAAMHQDPENSMVACQVMRLVNKTVSDRRQDLEDRVAQLAALVDRSSSEIREELRRSLDGDRSALLLAARSTWWHPGS